MNWINATVPGWDPSAVLVRLVRVLGQVVWGRSERMQLGSMVVIVDVREGSAGFTCNDGLVITRLGE